MPSSESRMLLVRRFDGLLHDLAPRPGLSHPPATPLFLADSGSRTSVSYSDTVLAGSSAVTGQCGALSKTNTFFVPRHLSLSLYTQPRDKSFSSPWRPTLSRPSTCMLGRVQVQVRAPLLSIKARDLLTARSSAFSHDPVSHKRLELIPSPARVFLQRTSQHSMVSISADPETLNFDLNFLVSTEVPRHPLCPSRSRPRRSPGRPDEPVWARAVVHVRTAAQPLCSPARTSPRKETSLLYAGRTLDELAPPGPRRVLVLSLFS